MSESAPGTRWEFPEVGGALCNNSNTTTYSEDFMTVDGVNHCSNSVGYYCYLRRNRHRTAE